MSILDTLLPVVIQSLTDKSDDVRSVAAVALLPVADALVNSVPQQVAFFDQSRCANSCSV